MSDEDIVRAAERQVNRIEKDETALQADRRRDILAPLKRSLDYEFLSELSPGIWKVVRKSDRFEFLARDVTKRLQTPEGEPTEFAQLLHPRGENVVETLMRILNHENLVNFVDWIQVQSGPTLKVSSADSQQYLLSDFCNAGTLAHLFIRPMGTAKTPLHSDQEARIPPHVTESDAPPASPAFLPEAFCWHVLCSLLRALAWLHHGIREEFDPETNEYNMIRADFDWQTIVHRDIKPSSVYFCHPQTKLETYGLCKLGGFKYAHVSGVFNGVLGDKVPGVPAFIAAPNPKQDSTPPLDMLRQAASNPNAKLEDGLLAPYTILDDYQAVGGIVASMMRWPTFWEGDSHFRDLGLRKASDFRWWAYYFNASPYTGALKNMVHLLLCKEDTEPLSTWNLYKKAMKAHISFLENHKEGQAVFMAEQVQLLRQEELNREQEDDEARLEHANHVYESHQTSLRFTQHEEPDELEELLRQVKVECTRAKEGRYETSAPA